MIIKKTIQEQNQAKKLLLIKDIQPTERYTVRYLVDELEITINTISTLINRLGDKVKQNKKKYSIEIYWQDIIDYITK